jgi:hypothetical protein
LWKRSAQTIDDVDSFDPDRDPILENSREGLGSVPDSAGLPGEFRTVLPDCVSLDLAAADYEAVDDAKRRAECIFPRSSARWVEVHSLILGDANVGSTFKGMVEQDGFAHKARAQSR